MLNSRIRLVFALLAAAALFLATGPAALAQAPASPAPKAPPAKRAKKVWTNEAVEELRTPSDAYLREKERLAEEARLAKEKEAEDAARKSSEANEAAPASAENPAAETPKPAVIPTTLPELEKRFDELSAKITALENRIAGIEELKTNGREDERAGADTLKQTLEKELEQTREEFYTVRDRLNALRRRP